MTARRPIPGMLGKCRRCGAAVVFARTLASPTGTGGRMMPFDPLEDAAGNVAVRATSTGRGVARALRKDETPDRTCELLAMPHAATCQPTIAGTTPAPALPPDVPSLDAHRARKQGRP